MKNCVFWVLAVDGRAVLRVGNTVSWTETQIYIAGQYPSYWDACVAFKALREKHDVKRGDLRIAPPPDWVFSHHRD